MWPVSPFGSLQIKHLGRFFLIRKRECETDNAGKVTKGGNQMSWLAYQLLGDVGGWIALIVLPIYITYLVRRYRRERKEWENEQNEKNQWD
jgi:hypothetical protein